MSQAGTVQTTLVSHEVTATGTNQYGAWALNVFTAADGVKFQTFKNEIASQVMALLNQPVDIGFSLKPNGDHVNNVIESIAPAGGAVVTAPATAPAAPAAAAPAAPAPAAPAAPAAPVAPASGNTKAEELRRQGALGKAIEAIASAGVSPLEDLQGLYELSEEFAKYIEGGIAAVTKAPTV